VIAAGGIFTGSDAVVFPGNGRGGVQVATRFTITNECGLPDKVKQEYVKASEEDIIVNGVSPTGYPMRMLKARRRSAPASVPAANPTATCSMPPATAPTSIRTTAKCWPTGSDKNIKVMDKTCLCTHMRNFNCWTCGHYTYRLKDTTHKKRRRQVPTAHRRARVQGLPVQHRQPDCAAAFDSCAPTTR
jgi:nitronate monooxygenase